MQEINITESEWKVMEVLFKKPYSTIKDIASELENSGWSYSTIKTLVLRLHKKQIIGADTINKNYKYYPLVSEENCKKKETRSFIDKIYGGSVKMMMTNLVGDTKLSDKDVKKLMEIIDKIEDGE